MPKQQCGCMCIERLHNWKNGDILQRDRDRYKEEKYI